jgi:diguanylate cyclase (GGDEF)-like protein
LLALLRNLTWPAAPVGLAVLAVLLLAVRAYPFAGRRSALAVTASTPLLAILALYGVRWAVLLAVVTTALETLVRVRRRLDPPTLLRGIGRAALATGLAGAAFTAMGGAPGHISLALMLPALVAAEVALALASWLLNAPRHAVETHTPYGVLVRESLLGSLPALAAEPVLALVLAVAALTPTASTVLAAVLPLAGLIIALRLHADMRGRLERAHEALRRAHEQLRIQATTDPLTGLANRRAFEEQLAVRVDEAARYGRPVGVLLLDLDGFKGINDTYGHAGGDAVLVAVAGALKRGLRRSDLPARLAGDEFVALLPETDGARALKLAERVCAEIAALKVSVGGTTVRPSASVGAASTDDHADAAGLLAAADGAAYTAKRSGKNAARLAPGLPRQLTAARRRARAAS